MMDNLETVICHLFKRVSAQDVLEGRVRADNISGERFTQLMRSYSNRYSDTEFKNLYRYLVCEFVDSYHGVEQARRGVECLDVFTLLRFYASWILMVEDNEIVCEYPKLLHWRMVTNQLSEELLVTCFIASWRVREDADHDVRLDWRTSITHNNRELRRILSRGIAENHSHLKGASPVFSLTWVSMMNDLSLYADSEELRRIEKSRRNVNIKYNPLWSEKPFSIQLLEAACIRVLLFFAVTGGYEKYIIECCNILSDDDKLISKRGYLTDIINMLKRPLHYKKLPDYVLTEVLGKGAERSSLTLIFQGERWLMYKMFSGIYEKEPGIMRYKNLFYAYLIIKENFRSEIIQSNSSVGFENFSIYEGRKDVFLDSPFWAEQLVKTAIAVSLIENNAVVSEARITPKDTAEKNLENIKRLDKMIDRAGAYRNRYFYVVHFIKAQEKPLTLGTFTCRHWKERVRYKRQAIALAGFRERYPYCADRIRGIDAANMEIGCGPEVFAQVFRFLSSHTVGLKVDGKICVPQLRVTYHVGEDFLDLVSGLRAIDEAVHFLGMRCGDRIGHALALGLDAQSWYAAKNNRILISQQEYLDNVAWMYHILVAFNVPEQERAKSFLKKEFEYYFQIVYRNAIDQSTLEIIRKKACDYYEGTEWEKYYSRRTYDFNIENYYSSWKLRGDDPQLYQRGFFENQEILRSSRRYWSYYAINRNFPQRQKQRYFQEIGMLYYCYHYNMDVRREGEKPIEKKISKEFVQCVQAIQWEIQKRIAKGGISVETNPSSNYLIGTFKSYDKHPILQFYNKGLVENSEELRRCPQIDVSINTDDAGIFATSLENEYAYMALALEKARDKDGNPMYKKKNIYTWIDNIRKMGLDQSFLSDDEMKVAVREWEQSRIIR